MKNVVLASVLGTLAGAFAIPRIGGPVHYQITRPYSMVGGLPNGGGTVTLGTAPLDFIITDIAVSTSGQFSMNTGSLLVNGATVLGMPTAYSTLSNTQAVQPSLHMTSGVFVPAGSTVAFSAFGGSPSMVTVVGYVQ